MTPRDDVAIVLGALIDAAHRFHREDNRLRPNDRTTDEWLRALIRRDDAMRAVRAVDANDETLAREDQSDAVSFAAARERIHAQRAARIMARPETPADWAALARTPATGALRTQALRRLTGKLLAAGLDPHLVVELIHGHNAARCQPPLRHRDVERLVDDVCDWYVDRLRGQV